MRKTLTIIFLAVFSCALVRAQERPEPVTYTDAYLDTVKVSSIFKLNDYWMVGVEYGTSFVRQRFVPKFSQETMMIPDY